MVLDLHYLSIPLQIISWANDFREASCSRHLCQKLTFFKNPLTNQFFFQEVLSWLCCGCPGTTRCRAAASSSATPWCPWRPSWPPQTHSRWCSYNRNNNKQSRNKLFTVSYRGIYKKVRGMPSHLFVTLYTLSIYLCTQTAETTSPELFSWILLTITITILRLFLSLRAKVGRVCKKKDQNHNQTA